MSKFKNFLNYLPRLVVAAIFFQTLFFKFTGSPESIYIFEKIGMEPFGRYFSGVIELIAGVLLLTPFYLVGAIISILVILPAIFFHFTSLGIVVQNDNGLLFGMSMLVFILGMYILLNKQNEIKPRGKK